ncbi:hypothetical protein [Serratia quinivorans]|uniref:hypothetical protein n=1 Tax=Serratia quinivorans TaxID=137545 RepID=UPI002E7864B7|nr:hypothetical protein [Serratia quinivorans]
MRGVYALLVSAIFTAMIGALGIGFCSSGSRSLNSVQGDAPYETSAPMLLRDFRENASSLEARIGQRLVRVYGQVRFLYLDSIPTPVVWLDTGDEVLPAEMILLAKQQRIYQVKPGDKVWLQCEAIGFDAQMVTGSDCVLE